MTEIKRQPVRAAVVADMETFCRERVAGSIHIGEVDSDGQLSFWYCCPCGCGAITPLNAGRQFKPDDGHASWNWNGSAEAPTLSPSVWHKGHWHGHLKGGVWTSCGSRQAQ